MWYGQHFIFLSLSSRKSCKERYLRDTSLAPEHDGHQFSIRPSRQSYRLVLETSCPRRPLHGLQAALGCTIAAGAMK